MAKIYIRTDGNKNIASGHIMRCLSVAYALSDLGTEPHFLLSDDESVQMFEACLDRKYSDIKKTVIGDGNYHEPETVKAVTGKDCVILLDSYAATEKYVNGLERFAKVAYIDDIREQDMNCDLVINYDIVTDDMNAEYMNSYKQAKRVLLGGKYAPLRRQFAGKKTVIRDDIRDILILTGNTDREHMQLGLVKNFPYEDYPDVTLHLVVGASNTDGPELKQMAADGKPIRIYEHVSDMADVMLKCDIAVSAGGTTLYELCALGIPTMGICIADNQKFSLKAFNAAGAVKYMGDIRKDDVFEAVFGQLKKYDRDTRAAQSLKMREICDGHGAERTAEEILDLL